MQAVAKTIVSPYFNITEPCACSAKSVKIAVKFSRQSLHYILFFAFILVPLQTKVLFLINKKSEQNCMSEDERIN